MKSVAGQTIQSTQNNVLKTILGHETVSSQPAALEYSVKSYGERAEVAAELPFPQALIRPHSAFWCCDSASK